MPLDERRPRGTRHGALTIEKMLQAEELGLDLPLDGVGV